MAAMSGTLTQQQFFSLWFPTEHPTDFSAALEAVDAFYRCSEEDAERTDENKPPAYAFGTDGAAIIAAFQREYGIDLTTAQMHWWRFTALLRGLLEHSFTERVQFRICDLEEIGNGKMRSRYQKLKRKYALTASGEPYHEPQTLEEYNALLLRQARGEK